MSVFWRPRGCVLWYDFAELSGDTVYDLSGNNNHGTIYNCEWRRGDLIGSLYFNGENAYVYVPNPIKLLPPFSLECFAYVTTTGREYQTLISRRDLSDNTNYALRLWNDSIEFYFKDVDTGNWVIHKAFDVVKTGWHYFYGGYDGSEVVIVYDGEVVSTASETRTPQTEFVHSEEIGSIKSGTREFWYGLIAHVRIYNRVLSQREIRAHANYLLQKYIAHPPFI